MATNPVFKNANTYVLIDALQNETNKRTGVFLDKTKTLNWRQTYLDPTSELIAVIKAQDIFLQSVLAGHSWLTNPTNDTSAGIEAAYVYLVSKGVVPEVR